MSIDILSLKCGDVVWFRVKNPAASKTPIHKLRFIEYANHSFGREIPPKGRHEAYFDDVTAGRRSGIETPEHPYWSRNEDYWESMTERMFYTEQEALDSLRSERDAALSRAKQHLKSAQERVEKLEVAQ